MEIRGFKIFPLFLGRIHTALHAGVSDPIPLIVMDSMDDIQEEECPSVGFY